MPFQSGLTKNVKFTVSGGALISYSIVEHSWEEAVDKLDITSTSHAGIQALLAGIFRGDGMVKAILNTDAGNMPWVAANGIRAGNNGVFQFFVSTTLYFQVPAMVVKVKYSSQVAGKVEWAGDISLNAEAGSYAYPS
jgi:hypothetical protein